LVNERERLGRVAKGLFGAETPDRPRPTQSQPAGSVAEAQIWRESIRLAEEEPRITFVSSKVKAILVYLRRTVPGVSASKITAEIVEDAVKQKYPELWRRLGHE